MMGVGMKAGQQCDVKNINNSWSNSAMQCCAKRVPSYAPSSLHLEHLWITCTSSAAGLCNGLLQGSLS